MTFAISFGKYGSFYFMRDATIRICLGWVALTWFPMDIDEVLEVGILHLTNPPN